MPGGIDHDDLDLLGRGLTRPGRGADRPKVVVAVEDVVLRFWSRSWSQMEDRGGGGGGTSCCGRDYPVVERAVTESVPPYPLRECEIGRGSGEGEDDDHQDNGHARRDCGSVRGTPSLLISKNTSQDDWSRFLQISSQRL